MGGPPRKLPAKQSAEHGREFLPRALVSRHSKPVTCLWISRRREAEIEQLFVVAREMGLNLQLLTKRSSSKLLKIRLYGNYDQEMLVEVESRGLKGRAERECKMEIDHVAGVKNLCRSWQ
jgi:hypothetical protein